MTAKDRGIIQDDQGVRRCWWCGTDPLYVDYHDQEWGRPVHNDVQLFEKICLEGFQAGLSWVTILKKREAFRDAFAGFDFQRVAKFGKREIERLVTNQSIVRHRGKIESTINNACQALQLLTEFDSLSEYFQQFRPAKSPKLRNKAAIVAVTEESKSLSKDLKRRGWSFVGPTTCYAFMQAMGLVNDHLVGCHVWETVDALQKSSRS